MLDILFMSALTGIVIGFAIMAIGMSLTIDGLVNLGFGIAMTTATIILLMALISGWFLALGY